MQRRSVAPVPVRIYDDFDVLIEGHEKTQKAFDGELPELAAQHLGCVRLPHTEQFGPRRFRIASILNTNFALTRCSSAFDTPIISLVGGR